MTGVRVILDVSDLRARLAKQGRDLTPALRRFNQRIAILVEQGAEKRLRGGGGAAPGAYPVPIRTGFLRRSLASQSDDTSATIFNTAEYAGSVHAGYRPYGNSRATPIPARPFLADALEDTDIVGEFNSALAMVFA